MPEAQSASRSFQVKVIGPCPAGIYSGMSGHILIPLDEEEVLVIPRQAVRSVGQLEQVNVWRDGRISLQLAGLAYYCHSERREESRRRRGGE